MVRDTSRNAAFAAAIAATVAPGDRVLDIGSGCGILSLFASRSGALRVTACESVPHLAEVSKSVIGANSSEHTAASIDVASCRLSALVKSSLPPYDVVMAELADSMGLGEGLVPMLRYAKRNFLKPKGKVIPAQLIVYGVLARHATPPIECVDLSPWDAVRYQQQDYTEVDVRREEEEGRLNLLSESIQLFAFDFRLDDPNPAEEERAPKSFDVELTTRTMPNAVVFHFWMDLGGGESLSNPPRGERAEGCHWLQAVRYCNTASNIASQTWRLTVALDRDMSDFDCRIEPVPTEMERHQATAGAALAEPLFDSLDPQWEELRHHIAAVGANLEAEIARRPKHEGVQIALAMAAQPGMFAVDAEAARAFAAGLGM